MSLNLEAARQKLSTLQEQASKYNRVMPASTDESRHLVKTLTGIRTELIEFKQEYRKLLFSGTGKELESSTRILLKRVETRIQECKTMKRSGFNGGDSQKLVAARLTFKLRNVIRKAEAEGRATLLPEERLCLERVEKLLTDVGYRLPNLERLLEHITEDA